MSGGYRIGVCQVLRDDATLSSDDLKRFSCVFCKRLLREAYQLTCGDHVCKSCMPSETFQCPGCGEGVDPSVRTCFADKRFRIEMKALLVVCQCTEKLALKEWENHYKSCPEVVREKPIVSPDERRVFPEEMSEEEQLQRPESEHGTTQQTISRNPVLTIGEREKLQDPLKTTLKNESLSLTGSIISILHDSSTPNQLPKSELVGPVLRSVSGTTLKEAPWDVKEYIGPNCHPKVLVILNANDGSCSNGLLSSIPSLSSSTEVAKLDAKKTCDLLMPVLQDCGFCVIPVINKSKRSLFELLGGLKQESLLKSIELVMFISTTHGRCDEICMNWEYVRIPELVRKLTEIDCQSFFSIFEGCQKGEGALCVDSVEKSYCAVYSVPPQSISVHYNGIGIFTKCLANLLSTPYVRSLKDLVDDLRLKLDKQLSEIFKRYPKNHTPICVENYSSGTINIHEITSTALKPRVENISRDAVRVSLKISAPKRLLHHPGGEKFELRNLSVVVVEGEETREVLAEETLEFGGIWHVTVELPPRAKRTLEDLEVVACYKDGRKESKSSGPLNCPLPVYDVPSVVSCTQNHCKVDITFLAKQEQVAGSTLYSVDTIEWRYLPGGEWTRLEGFFPSDDEQNCSVSVPHSHPDDKTAYRVQIRKHYDATSTYVDSNTTKADRLELRFPDKGSIECTQCCSKKIVRFDVNKCCEQLEISECGVMYWINKNEDPERLLGDCRHGTVEVEIPFLATQFQTYVRYSNYGEVSGILLLEKNSCYKKCCNAIGSYVYKNKCRAFCQLLLSLAMGICAVVFVLLLACLLCLTHKLNTEVIVSNTTIGHHFLKSTSWSSLAYKEVHVDLYPILASDNPNMNVSIFNISSSMRSRNITISLPESIIHLNGDGKQCLYLSNEYGNPTYFGRGSTISAVTAEIRLPDPDDRLHSAKLFGMDYYYMDVQDRCMRGLHPIFSMNLSSTKLKPFTVTKDSYIYFLVETDASSEVTVRLKLNLLLIYYPGLNDMPATSYKIIDSVWLNHSASIPIELFKGTTRYLFAHDVGEFALRTVHLNFTLVPRNEFQVIGIGITAILFVILFFFFLLCTFIFPIKHKTHTETTASDRNVNSNPHDCSTSNETTPLINS